MSETDRLVPDTVVLDLAARTKSEVLLALAERAGALLGRGGGEIARALADRERLGSTGVGSAVALPHADLRDLDRPIALFARLARPVDWDAIDDRPVELVVAVLSPPDRGEASPRVLARFARVLRDAETRRGLTLCPTAERAFEIFARGA